MGHLHAIAIAALSMTAAFAAWAQTTDVNRSERISNPRGVVVPQRHSKRS